MRMTVPVVIEPRPDGGVRIWAKGTGIILSSPDTEAAFSDFATALSEVWRVSSAIDEAVSKNPDSPFNTLEPSTDG